MEREFQICSNCVMDTTDSKIVFDEKGVCDHCNTYYKDILPNWHTDEIGDRELTAIIKKIKKEIDQLMNHWHLPERDIQLWGKQLYKEPIN